ncbi:MAG TPA: hypothetical protein VLL76_08855 [Candidatus Omnitrophota bacterium]|nr:hypothetical protein [Candidatus Omnitrophota bacterium]
MPQPNQPNQPTEHPRPHPGDDAAPGTPGTGEDICRQCNGTGKVDGRICDNCDGTGVVIEGIGGA